MPIAKIEPTGCCVRKGKVQLRFSFYLEPSDPRYEEYHVQVPIIPPEGYQGEVDADGNPIDQADYDAWIESLPREWQNNPFHNHFVYVDADTPNSEIKKLMVESLNEFFGIWAEGVNITEAWRRRPLKSKKRFIVGDLTPENITICEAKAEDIKLKASEFQIIGVS